MTIGADEGRGGSQEVGGVDDSTLLIYAVRLLEGGANRAGGDGPRPNSPEIQASAISRRLSL